MNTTTARPWRAGHDGKPLCACGGVLIYCTPTSDVHTYEVTVQDGELIGDITTQRVYDGNNDAPPWLQCQTCHTQTPITGLDELR